MSHFSERTMKLVQQLEDMGHGTQWPHTPSYRMTQLIAEHMDLVCSYYAIPPCVMIECQYDYNNTLTFHVSMSQHCIDIIRRNEPDLFAALTHDPHKCVCQAIPGIAHAH